MLIIVQDLVSRSLVKIGKAIYSLEDQPELSSTLAGFWLLISFIVRPILRLTRTARRPDHHNELIVRNMRIS